LSVGLRPPAGNRTACALPRPCSLGDAALLREVADGAAESERALLFGAQQLALQHRALWDLLEAREQARAEY